MKLNSDFKEWYDYIFDDEPPTITRYSNSGPEKKLQFDIMEYAGLRVIPRGKLRKLIQDGSSEQFVIYINQYAHNGDGKILCRKNDKNKYFYDDELASVYFDTGNDKLEIKSESYRLLVIGRKSFIIRYVSYQDWRSNCGEGETKLIRVGPDIFNDSLSLLTPIYAIDYINAQGKGWCIDYNVAPGTSGICLFNYIKAQEIKDEILWWYSAQMAKNTNSILEAQTLKLQKEFLNFTIELGIS